MIVFITTGYGQNVIGGADIWCNNFIENILPLVSQQTNYSIVTPEIVKLWDTTWDCLVNSNYLDKPLDYCKTNNPFAYFTQIAWNAFIRRIHKEKKQTYIKHKNFENSFLMNELWEGDSNMQMVANEYSSEVVKSYEDKLTKVKKNSRVTGVEKFSEN